MTEDKVLTGPSANLESETNNNEVETDETTEFQSATIKKRIFNSWNNSAFFHIQSKFKRRSIWKKIIEKHFLKTKKSQQCYNLEPIESFLKEFII